MQLITTLAAVSATIATVHAASAYVYNHCSQDVYLWAVDTERNPSSPTKVAAGSSWSETYHTPSSGGVSIKISKDTTCDKITQFEYTVTSGTWNQVWYDGSNINCVGSECPFTGQNLYLGASVSSCPQRYCAASDKTCAGFYNAPEDNTATLSCDPSADTFLHLCLPDAQMPGGSSSGSASGSAAAAAPSSTTYSSTSASLPTSTKVRVMEAPVATTFYKVVTKTARSIAERSPEPEALAVHAHARRHLHHRV